MTDTIRLSVDTQLVKQTPTVTVIRVDCMGAVKDVHVPHWVVEPHMWAVGDFMRSHRQLGGYLIHQIAFDMFDVILEPQRKVA